MAGIFARAITCSATSSGGLRREVSRVSLFADGVPDPEALKLA